MRSAARCADEVQRESCGDHRSDNERPAEDDNEPVPWADEQADADQDRKARRGENETVWPSGPGHMSTLRMRLRLTSEVSHRRRPATPRITHVMRVRRGRSVPHYLNDGPRSRVLGVGCWCCDFCLDHMVRVGSTPPTVEQTSAVEL